MGGLRRRKTLLTSARDSAFSADTLGASRDTSAGAPAGEKRHTALALEPGHAVAFDVNEAGEVVLRKVGGARGTRAPAADRFEAVRGKADIKWRTEDLMALLRD